MADSTGCDTQFSRLGKRELGPYAFEERMPSRLYELLRDRNSDTFLSGVVPNLALLLDRDPDVDLAFVCTEHACQVSKLQQEGAHFCGYRNLQMLCGALTSTDQRVAKLLPLKIDIAELQGLIEKAWDDGFNPHGRIQTGGIEGTRKHIGTSEAEAVLLSLGVRCTGTYLQGRQAWKQLLEFIEAYFQSFSPNTAVSGVYRTGCLPVFLQRPNHSLTIVGFMRSKSGKCRLLAFDPAWQPPSEMRSPLPIPDLSAWSVRMLLHSYQKSESRCVRSAFIGPTSLVRASFADWTTSDLKYDGLPFSDLSLIRFTILAMEMVRDATDEILPHDSINPNAESTVLLIHGAVVNRTEWDLVTPHISEYHLLVPDQPSHGKAARLKPYSIQYAAHLLSKLIREKAHGGVVHVVGFSLGASVALRLATDHPDIVQSMLITGYTNLPRTQLTPYLPHAIWMSNRIENAMPRTLARWLMDGTDVKRGDPNIGTVELLRSIFVQGLTDQQPCAWRTRTLVIAATKSGIMPSNDNVNAAKKLAEIGRELNPRTLAVFHPKMRHPWNRQAPQLFADTIKAWVEEKELPEGFERVP